VQRKPSSLSWKLVCAASEYGSASSIKVRPYPRVPG
jgi:hypothetical protein